MALLYTKRRRENAEHPTLVPWQFNERVPEQVAPQRPADPPRAGETPGVRPSRRQVYQMPAKRAHHMPMAQHQSGVIRSMFRKIVSSPRGVSLPWIERANIQSGQPESYGTRFEVVPRANPHYEDELLAEMGL